MHCLLRCLLRSGWLLVFFLLCVHCSAFRLNDHGVRDKNGGGSHGVSDKNGHGGHGVSDKTVHNDIIGSEGKRRKFGKVSKSPGQTEWKEPSLTQLKHQLAQLQLLGAAGRGREEEGAMVMWDKQNKRSSSLSLGINTEFSPPAPADSQRRPTEDLKRSRPYDVPQIECPLAEDGMERFACPTPDAVGRYRCVDDHVLCDGFIDCPNAEDEERQACMFYKTTKAHLDVLADALLRWARGK